MTKKKKMLLAMTGGLPRANALAMTRENGARNDGKKSRVDKELNYEFLEFLIKYATSSAAFVGFLKSICKPEPSSHTSL